MLKSNPCTLEPKLGGVVPKHQNKKDHHIRLGVKMAFEESRSRGIQLGT